MIPNVFVDYSVSCCTGVGLLAASHMLIGFFVIFVIRSFYALGLSDLLGDLQQQEVNSPGRPFASRLTRMYAFPAITCHNSKRQVSCNTFDRALGKVLYLNPVQRRMTNPNPQSIGWGKT